MKKNRLYCVLAALLVFDVPLARATDHMVGMYYYGPDGYYDFSPGDISVVKGDTVTWVNEDFYFYGGHSATSGTNGVADGLWDSTILANGGDQYTLDTSSLSVGVHPYYCQVHGAYGMTGTLTVTAPNLPPSISITNPISGKTFAAPATVTLQANASDSGGGAVTNVQFFSGVTSLGNVTAAPFNLSVANLPAGNYTFTAEAFDTLGTTNLSAPVTVYVQTNSTFNGSAAGMTGNGFKLTLNGIAGQTYTIEVSSNMVNWTPLLTNVAPSDVFSITDSTVASSLGRFYRARQN